MIEEIQAIKKELIDLKNQRDDFGLATELIKDKKKEATRLFWIWIITFLSLIGLGIFTLSKLEDMQRIENTEEVEQTNEGGGDNNYTRAGGDVNGKTEDKD